MYVKADIKTLNNIISNLKDCRENSSTSRENIIEVKKLISENNANIKKQRTVENRVVTSANNIVATIKANIVIREALQKIISTSQTADGKTTEKISALSVNEGEATVNTTDFKSGNTEESTDVLSKFISTLKLNNGDYIGLTAKEVALYNTIKANSGSLKDLWTSLGYSSYNDFVKDYGITEEEANKINEDNKKEETQNNTSDNSDYPCYESVKNLAVDDSYGNNPYAQYVTGKTQYSIDDGNGDHYPSDGKLSKKEYDLLVWVSVHEESADAQYSSYIASAILNSWEKNFSHMTFGEFIAYECSTWCGSSSDDLFNAGYRSFHAKGGIMPNHSSGNLQTGDYDVSTWKNNKSPTDETYMAINTILTKGERTNTATNWSANKGGHNRYYIL